jgi:hypothetical protein
VTSDDWVKIIGALAGGSVLVISAFVRLELAVRDTHRLVNSRMTELLDITKASALAQGKLEGPGSVSH